MNQLINFFWIKSVDEIKIKGKNKAEEKIEEIKEKNIKEETKKINIDAKNENKVGSEDVKKDI